jgi:hypothetical protein
MTKTSAVPPDYFRRHNYNRKISFDKKILEL